MQKLQYLSDADLSQLVGDFCAQVPQSYVKQLTLHTALYPVDELVGLAAVQQSSDGWKGVQNNGLRVGINVFLKHRDTDVLKIFPTSFYLPIFLYYLSSRKKSQQKY